MKPSALSRMKQTKREGSEQVMACGNLGITVIGYFGTIIESIIGEFLPFSTRGTGFFNDRTFVVILVNQLKKADRYFPFIIGELAPFSG